MYDLILSVRFQKQLKKLISRDSGVKARISKSLKTLLTDIDHPSLRLHKLSGRDNWSISMTKSIRIILHIEGNKIYLLEIGKHEEVY